MPETIETTIYKLELDSSGYIVGVDNMIGRQKMLAEAVNIANDRLRASQAALQNATQFLLAAKDAQDKYRGSNQQYIAQLANDINKATAAQDKATKRVEETQKAYDAAKKSAFDYTEVALRAANTQAKNIQPGIPAPNTTGIQNLVTNLQNLLSGPVTLNDVLLSVTKQFDVLSKAIEQADEVLKTLSKDSEEFKTLSPIVEQAKAAMDRYKEAMKSGGVETKSLRQQIQEARKALDIMEASGNADAASIKALEVEIARLTERMRTQTQTINVLASESRALDFGKASIKAAISVFEVFTATQILTGGATEELEKKTMQLFAAMQLLTALEEVHNAIKKGSVIQTNLASAAQVTYAFVVNASTVALKAFRLALVSTGIGAAIVAIGYLIEKWSEYTEKVKAAKEEQKAFEEYQSKIADGFIKEQVNLEQIRIKLTDLNIPLEKRKELAKQYNDEADKGNQIDLTQLNNIDQINKAITDQIALLERRARTKAAEDYIAEAQKDVWKAQAKAEEEARAEISATRKKGNDEALQESKDAGKKQQAIIQTNDDELNSIQEKALEKRNQTQKEKDKERSDQIKNAGLLDKTQQKELSQFQQAADEQQIQRSVKTNEEVVKKQKILEERTKKVSQEITIEGLTGKAKEEKEKKTPQGPKNVFLEESQRLNAQLEYAKKTELEGRTKIIADYVKKLELEKARIEQLVRDKKLKGSINDAESQAGFIYNLTVQVNTLERDKALKEFNDKAIESQKELDKELKDLQMQRQENELALIEDEFQQRAATIDFNQKKEISQLDELTKEKLDKLDKQYKEELISLEQYEADKLIVLENSEITTNDIIVKYARQRRELAAGIVKDILDSQKEIIDNADLIRTEENNKAIKALNEQYLSNEISFRRYQKELAKIEKEETKQRIKDTIQQLKNEIKIIQAAQRDALATKQPQNVTDDLAARLIQAREQIANLERQLSKGQENKDIGKDGLTPAGRIASYTKSIGELADSVIAFWDKANKAEEAALDRSIAIQERRVTEAQKLADRGNATYLKGETDRLKKLQIAKENAARRDIAINAALQTSQLLVAITGAIAKIKDGPSGPAEVISAIAIIVSSLAAGYGIVKSLQSNQPKFRKGTTEVKQGGHPQGIDTIPAWLTAGEAVIPVEQNKQYRKSIEAIYHEKVPANVLNTFVENYVGRKKPEDMMSIVTAVNSGNQKTMPILNVDKIKESSEHKSSHDVKLANIISEQNTLMRESIELNKQTVRALRTIGVNVNIDRNGFAMSLMEVAEREKIQRKV